MTLLTVSVPVECVTDAPALSVGIVTSSLEPGSPGLQLAGTDQSPPLGLIQVTVGVNRSSKGSRKSFGRNFPEGRLCRSLFRAPRNDRKMVLSREDRAIVIPPR